MDIDWVRWACDVPWPPLASGAAEAPGSTDRLVLIQLARHLEMHDDGIVRAKVLAHMASLSDRAVRESLDLLCASRLIEMVRSRGRAPAVRLLAGRDVANPASGTPEPASEVPAQLPPGSTPGDSGTSCLGSPALTDPAPADADAGSTVRRTSGGPAVARTPEPASGVGGRTASSPVELAAGHTLQVLPCDGVLLGIGDLLDPPSVAARDPQAQSVQPGKRSARPGDRRGGADPLRGGAQLALPGLGSEEQAAPTHLVTHNLPLPIRRSRRNIS